MTKEDRKGMLISFEGIDNTGKTTQAKILHERLLAMEKKAIYTREIGGCSFAESIRDLLKRHVMPAEIEILLLTAARAEHCYVVINDAVNDGNIVVCDRFIDSTIAYQCFASDESALEETCFKTLREELLHIQVPTSSWAVSLLAQAIDATIIFDPTYIAHNICHKEYHPVEHFFADGNIRKRITDAMGNIKGNRVCNLLGFFFNLHKEAIAIVPDVVVFLEAELGERANNPLDKYESMSIEAKNEASFGYEWAKLYRCTAIAGDAFRSKCFSCGTGTIEAVSEYVWNGLKDIIVL